MQLIQASAHHLPMIPDGSIQLICCSPPYFGLRQYQGGKGICWPTVEYAPMPGLPMLRIQGCEDGCEHEWADELRKHPGDRNGAHGPKQTTNRGAAHMNDGAGTGAYCLRCGGWRGELGLEPTVEAYIGHLLLCLREWHRILRTDGTCWVNLGSTYVNKQDQGIPWRFAFAAQAEGWWLRSDLIWDKPNPMPESVTDRCTKAHEYIFMLAKSPTYYFDADAVREEHKRLWDGNNGGSMAKTEMAQRAVNGEGHQGWNHKGEYPLPNPLGRNRRSVWRVATQSTPFAHFATWPEKLVEPMILAGTSARGCCPRCKAGYVRCVERTADERQPYKTEGAGVKANGAGRNDGKGLQKVLREDGRGGDLATKTSITTGWAAQCQCDAGEPVPCVVMDPFSGSGTTGKVAARLGRDYIGVDISNEYLTEITAQRFGDGIQMTMQGL